MALRSRPLLSALLACGSRTATGEAPPETVEVIALFTDNDQTREPVETYYGTVRALPR